MKVLIFNKKNFNQFMQYNCIDDSSVESQDMMIISINNPYVETLYPDTWIIKSYFKRNHFNVLIEHFPDFGENISYDQIGQGNFSVFSEYKAKRMYEFIKKNKDKSLAIIHCGAGISRSGAVGTFIHDLYGTVSWDEFKRKNPQISPNMYILKLLQQQRLKDK